MSYTAATRPPDVEVVLREWLRNKLLGTDWQDVRVVTAISAATDTPVDRGSFVVIRDHGGVSVGGLLWDHNVGIRIISSENPERERMRTLGREIAMWLLHLPLEGTAVVRSDNVSGPMRVHETIKRLEHYLTVDLRAMGGSVSSD